MQRLRSALPVSHTFLTGNKPVIVAANDGNTYVAKACKEGTPAYRLFKEALGSAFAEAWGIATPEPVVLDLHPDHLDALILKGINPCITCPALLQNTMSRQRIGMNYSKRVVALTSYWILPLERPCLGLR